MKNTELENKIGKAFSAVSPDDFGSILSDCEKQKGTVIVMTEKRRPNIFKKISAVAAAIVILAGVALGVQSYVGNNVEMAAISLDVNPGIEISINRKERVIDVTALNEDGKTVIGDMDLRDSDLDVAVNALIGSMLKNGYINENANSVLISVSGQSAAENEKLRTRLSDDISAMLGSDFDSAILTQQLDKDDQIAALAKQYGISEGKAQYISKIVAATGTHTFEELAPLSINELNLISGSGNTTPEKVQSVGSASEKAYVGRDKALEAVMAHLGAQESELKALSIDMDYENGVMVYEVDFHYNGREYDYDVNAVTAQVLKTESERDDDIYDDIYDDDYDDRYGDDSVTSSPGSGTMDAQNAKSIAFKHAGVSESAVYDLEIELDIDDGVPSYEMEFKSGGYEYEYDIHAESGKILKSEKDRDD